jgi:hypothetical protein
MVSAQLAPDGPASRQAAMPEDGVRVTRAMFEQNLAAKKTDNVFCADMTPTLANGQTWNFQSAYELVWRELMGRLPGVPWKGG